MIKETRVFMVACEQDDIFNYSQDIIESNPNAFISKAEEMGTVYTLSCFQQACNDEEVNIDNSFMLITNQY